MIFCVWMVLVVLIIFLSLCLVVLLLVLVLMSVRQIVIVRAYMVGVMGWFFAQMVFVALILVKGVIGMKSYVLMLVVFLLLSV